VLELELGRSVNGAIPGIIQKTSVLIMADYLNMLCIIGKFPLKFNISTGGLKSNLKFHLTSVYPS
jgi:hypothetical protein